MSNFVRVRLGMFDFATGHSYVITRDFGLAAALDMDIITALYK